MTTAVRPASGAGGPDSQRRGGARRAPASGQELGVSSGV